MRRKDGSHVGHEIVDIDPASRQQGGQH
jgi:hypothetical protein